MNLDERFAEERDKIVKGLEETYRKVIEYKKRINSPMIVMQDGKIAKVDPHDMPPTTVYKRK